MKKKSADNKTMPAKLSSVQRVNSNNIALHENIVQMTTEKKSKVFEHEITNIVLTHQFVENEENDS